MTTLKIIPVLKFFICGVIPFSLSLLGAFGIGEKKITFGKFNNKIAMMYSK